MKELIRVRVQYASRQQCCKTHKRPLPYLTYVLSAVSWRICIDFIVSVTAARALTLCGPQRSLQACGRRRLVAALSQLFGRVSHWCTSDLHCCIALHSGTYLTAGGEWRSCSEGKDTVHVYTSSEYTCAARTLHIYYSKSEYTVLCRYSNIENQLDATTITIY